MGLFRKHQYESDLSFMIFRFNCVQNYYVGIVEQTIAQYFERTASLDVWQAALENSNSHLNCCSVLSSRKINIPNKCFRSVQSLLGGWCRGIVLVLGRPKAGLSHEQKSRIYLNRTYEQKIITWAHRLFQGMSKSSCQFCPVKSRNRSVPFQTGMQLKWLSLRALGSNPSVIQRACL